jgi:hypothetical protein
MPPMMADSIKKNLLEFHRIKKQVAQTATQSICQRTDDPKRRVSNCTLNLAGVRPINSSPKSQLLLRDAAG